MQEHSDDPVSWLKDEMLIDYPQDAEILRVAMKGTRKGDVVQIVDVVVKKYLSEVVAAAQRRSPPAGIQVGKEIRRHSH